MFRDEDGPGLAGVAEHLLGLEEVTFGEDHVADGLGRCGSCVEGLLDAIDEGDADLRRLVVGAAFDLELTAWV